MFHRRHESAWGDPDVYLDEWAAGLETVDVAVCTVHPPRGGFHCSVYAALVLVEYGLPTILVPTTGIIVPGDVIGLSSAI